MLQAISSLILLAAMVRPVATTMPERNPKELVRQYIETCLDGADLDCLSKYWVEEKAINVRKSEDLRRSLFPDLSYEVVDIIAEGKDVVAILAVRGTHTGSDPLSPSKGKPAIPASHNTLDTEEAVIYEVYDGAIQSGRLISDTLAVAKALGYTIEPPSGE